MFLDSKVILIPLPRGAFTLEVKESCSAPLSSVTLVHRPTGEQRPLFNLQARQAAASAASRGEGGKHGPTRDDKDFETVIKFHQESRHLASEPVYEIKWSLYFIDLYSGL